MADSQASLETPLPDLAGVEEAQKEEGQAMKTYKLWDKEITEEQLNNSGYSEEEKVRIRLTPVVNAAQDDQIQGETWDTEKLQQDYNVLGFAAPFIMVERKSDGVRGTLMFRHHPRVYFNFVKS